VSFVAEVVLVVLAAVGAAVCVGALAVRLPAGRPYFESRLRPPVSTQLWPSQLVLLERIVGWSGSSDLDAHSRLRPVLIEIAEVRLARRGLRLERDVAEVRQLLGPKAWALLRPDRPRPKDHDTPGLTQRDIEEILDALEAL
jgi:hypothetical protein